MTRNQNHDDDNASSSSSRKRFKNFNHNGVASWSDVNHDVLFLIMMKLGVVDFVAFSGVCKSWRSFAVSNKNTFMASKPPMKISIGPHVNKEDSYYLLEDLKERRFKTIIPHSSCRAYCGLTCGYLILFGWETHDFWLVNPITRDELHFPDYPLSVGAREEEMWAIRGILVFSQAITGWVFLVLHGTISFCIAGKKGWNHVSSTLPIADLHVFKGKIYTLHAHCSLGELILDLKSEWKGKWTLLETKSFPKPDLYFLRLASSNEKLFVIGWVSKQKMFMELDFGEMKWVSAEKTIQEYAIFYSYFNYSAAFILELWADSQTQQTGYHEYFLDDDKSRKCMVYFDWMWYFPHDCLNVNFLDE
ncbi:unnamed protein product [Lactuca virosa]|uniref:F-box domain-containing protein n=1 Tax=Lactuca virosa TaxID=75947 RepID=A0AAU9PFF6_9ASTR|nr:unnamed protein product [Lactuca virosa]